MDVMKPWREEYLVYGAPYIGDEEKREIQECLASGWVGSGPRVKQFEEQFLAYKGTKLAVALNSGTAALFMALKSLKLSPGAEVITSAMTFCATANAIVNAGYTPVIVDCELDSKNIDPQAIAAAVTSRTEAIMPVHFAGQPCDMDAIMVLAQRHSLAVIEDCAHAIEARFRGRHCGTFGEFGCFSFYVTKNVTTVEGGMLITERDDLGDRLRSNALHGLSRDAWHRFSDKGYVHYEVFEPGHKCNLTDLAASMGIHQLARVEEGHARRQELWDYYLAELADLPLMLPQSASVEHTHALHLFSCLVDPESTEVTRDEVLAAMHGLKIGTGVHYTALHKHPFYEEHFPPQSGDLPNAEFIGERTFSIPLSMAVSREDAGDVVRALRLIFEQS